MRASSSLRPQLKWKHNSRIMKSVTKGVFSRLDEDGSGKVDADELCDFIVRAMNEGACTPRAKAMLGGNPTEVEKIVHRLVKKYDVNRDGEIDEEEFRSIVRERRGNCFCQRVLGARRGTAIF